MKPITEIFTGTIFQTGAGNFFADSDRGLLERVASVKDNETSWLWRVSKRRYTGFKHIIDTGTFARRHNTSVDIFKILEG